LPSNSQEELEAEFQSISRDVQILVNAVNESITTALETDDISARKREVAAARATITELQSVSARHPSVELERVEQVMVLIGKIDR
jgi:hypothetical protein